MTWAKLVFIALSCSQISSAAVADEDVGNCSTFPDNDAPAGQRALLQHSELHRSVALPTRLKGNLEGYSLIGNGQCADADGTTEYYQLGWAPCVCDQPVGSICTAGTCPSVEICASECDAEEDCSAFGWYPGHCWLYQTRPKPYVSTTDQFAYYQCYAKTLTTTTTTSWTGAWFAAAPNTHCAETCTNNGYVNGCDEAKLAQPVTEADTNAIATSLGYPCTGYRSTTEKFSPAVYTYEGQKTCYWKPPLTTDDQRKCGALPPSTPIIRFCPCGGVPR